MRAADAAWLLSAIGRGGRVEVPPGLEGAIDELEGEGLVRTAPDPARDRRTMDAMKADLAKLGADRAAGNSSPEVVQRERALRSAIVELSERLAAGEGAAEVVRAGGDLGPFRGGGVQAARFTLTQKGRGTLGDLAVRAHRVGAMSLSDFQREMESLRASIHTRVARAAEIAASLAHRETLGRAARSVPLGLAAVRAEPARVARAFDTTFAALRGQPMAADPTRAFTVEQDAAATECLALTVADLAALEHAGGALAFHQLRHTVGQSAAPGDLEDALDAATLLVTVHESLHGRRILLATNLALEVIGLGTRLTLSLALVALAGEDEVPPHLARRIVELDRALATEVPNANERIATAVLLSVPGADPDAQLERWRTLRPYLSRFSADGMAVAAALLSWIALDPAELLDNLRLASASITKHRLAEGAAETITQGIKLLLTMAALAAGREGDAEEGLALAPRAGPRLAQLGLHGTLSALPLAAATAAAFHTTVLDAALAWEAVHRPTHSTYVFGTHGLSGHRSSSSSSSSRGWGYG